MQVVILSYRPFSAFDLRDEGTDQIASSGPSDQEIK
jgi:hypothetical protein